MMFPQLAASQQDNAFRKATSTIETRPHTHVLAEKDFGRTTEIEQWNCPHPQTPTIFPD